MNILEKWQAEIKRLVIKIDANLPEKERFTVEDGERFCVLNSMAPSVCLSYVSQLGKFKDVAVLFGATTFQCDENRYFEEYKEFYDFWKEMNKHLESLNIQNETR